MFRSLHDWLSCPDPALPGDLIFVLAGREDRKHFGLMLFHQDLAPRLLFSVARFEIRRFSKMSLPVPLDLLALAQTVPPPRRHYFVLFEGQSVSAERISPGRFGTLTEIRSLALWLEKNPQIRSLLLVSNSAHLRRVRLCCRTFLGLELHWSLCATPEPFAAGDAQKSTSGSSGAASLLELFKLLVYWIVLNFRRPAQAHSPGSV